MNEKVRNYIDKLFEGKQMTEQALELRDELLDSASQRFEDDVADGLSEDEALKRIADSLGDVDELLKDYARDVAHAQDVSGIEARFDVNAITTISVSLNALGMAIEAIDGDEVMIAFEGPEEDFEDVRYRLDDGVLKIKQKNDIFFGLFRFFGWRKHSKVRIGVPERAALNYRINCVAGGVSSNVDIREAKISTVSGSIRVKPVSGRVANLLNVDCASGSVTIEGRYQQTKIDIVSGHVTFDGESQRMRVQSTSGSHTISGRFGAIDMQAISGKMNIDGEFEEAKLETVSGPIYMRCQKAPEVIVANMVSGSLNLELPEDIDGFIAKHSAVSGRLHNAFDVNPYGNGHTRITVEAVSGPLRITRGLTSPS